MTRRNKDDIDSTLPLSFEEADTAESLRTTRTINSALWAAYADALGFITELADEKTLKYRLAGQKLDNTIAWRRRIGGRQGVQALLPAGCYSDDTQLRLSTGRAISAQGFDVEAFAKIELTVWPAYALGGGKGTKAAAANLIRDQVPWYANTFKGWVDAGGNGAAMRIQPHVWAAPNLDDLAQPMLDLVANAVCSHGSPTGILGAVLHGQLLAHTLRTGQVPTPSEAVDLLHAVRDLPDQLQQREELGLYWLGAWERDAKRSFSEAWANELAAAERALSAVSDPKASFEVQLQNLDLFNQAIRGSGLLTAVAALALARQLGSSATALLEAVQLLGSDTDTIATMAGALYGATPTSPPLGPVLDAELIEAEARRLALLAAGEPVPGHRYPDLLTWSPPRTQSDALGTHDRRLTVQGLGYVTALDETALPPSTGDFQWQWVKTEFGQTLLIKRRAALAMVPQPSHAERHNPAMQTAGAVVSQDHTTRTWPDQSDQLPVGQAVEGHHAITGTTEQRYPRPLDRGVRIEDVVRYLDDEGWGDRAIGYALRRVARDGTTDQLLLLTGILRDRLRR